jgi:hypothetical protein
MTSIEAARAPMAGHVRARVWVISDLQQAHPEKARACLTTAVRDFQALELPCQQIWYLGDSVEGTDLPRLEEMAAMQHEMLLSLNVPLRFVLGNHDLDYALRDKGGHEPVVPFHRLVLRTPGWKTIPSLADFYFTDEIGGHRVVFFSDHATARWATTHGILRGQSSEYPYTREQYHTVRNLIAGDGRPCITAAHYAFAGGNRPSALLDQMLPLPANLRLHLYAHAHIGDRQWAGKDCFRKIAWVDEHPLRQVDVASLENVRGSATRSVLLEIYDGGAIGLLFRNHDRQCWSEIYVFGANEH